MKCKPENDEYDHQTLQLMRMQAIKAIQGGQSATEVTKAEPPSHLLKPSTAGWPTISAVDRRRYWPNPSLTTPQNYSINR